jgi:hypothetical protein
MKTCDSSLKKLLSKIESKFPLQGTAPKGVVDANHAMAYDKHSGKQAVLSYTTMGTGVVPENPSPLKSLTFSSLARILD